MRIGHCRRRTSQAEGSGPRSCTRTLRPDEQQTCLVDARDRAAAERDRMNIDRRQRDDVIADAKRRALRNLRVLHRSDIATRAAYFDSHDRRVTHAARISAQGVRASSRTGQSEHGRPLPQLLEGSHTAAALDEIGLARQSQCTEALPYTVQIRHDTIGDARIHRHSRAALELTDDGRHLVRRADEHIRQ